MYFQPCDNGDMFAFVALNTLDLNLGRCLSLGVACFSSSSFGFLLGGIFGCTLSNGY